ncbi:MAG: AtpZ/AtpI family protein [Tissierellia bacterium]|nr:AtpZ/AtpI family protein [Tissierellia bacterium]
MKKSAYNALVEISQLGLNVFIPIIAGILIGNWVDNKLGSGGVGLIVGIVVGSAAGILNILKLGRKYV